MEAGMADEVTMTQKRNIVILGRIGTGKKSIANQILDQQHFNVGSSMDSVTRDASTEDVQITDKKRKVHYNIKIIDTVGPYSTVVEKKTIFDQIQDYSIHKAPGVNLIIFVLRKDVYNIKEEIEIFETILEDFQDDIREISALVITGCEGLDDVGRQRVIQEIRTCPNTRDNGDFMGKGIHPVGFPSLQNTIPVLKEALGHGIASDGEMLRELALHAGVMINLQQDIHKGKLQSMKYMEGIEKISDPPGYSGSAWPKQSTMEAVADEVTMTQKRNIVILGRIGTGKKSIANQILDKQRFNVGLSMDSVTRDASTEDVQITDEKRMVHYNIKIIDTVGRHSRVVDKKTILHQIQDYSINKVPEGVNLIIFTLRKDVYNIAEEIEVFKTILKDFRDDIREISALVITFCEGLDEVGKERVIQEIRTGPNTRDIANFMGKDIHPVGFPTLQNTTPVLKEALEQGIAFDAEKLRKLVLDAGVMILQQDILGQKLQSMKYRGKGENSSEYPGSTWKQCTIS